MEVDDTVPHKIFPSFYLGSMKPASDLDTLYDHDITHILTVATGIKPKWPKKFKYMTVDILDMDDQNIKQHFRKCSEFIETGRQDGAVLVHCVAGVSRSATICVAYVLQKLKVNLDDAFGLVKDAKGDICPNDGFMKQLKEFEQEILNIAPPPQPAPQPTQPPSTTKTKAKSKTKKTTEPPPQNSPHEQPPSTKTTAPSPSSSSSSSFPSVKPLEAALPRAGHIPENAHTKYCCRMCGTNLFTDVDLMEHDKGEGQTSFDWKKRGNNARVDCTSYFVQELTMFGDTSEMEGKLVCPKCKSKFGGWNWAGAQCSCGVWVTPAFQVPKARVDVKQIKKT